LVAARGVVALLITALLITAWSVIALLISASSASAAASAPAPAATRGVLLVPFVESARAFAHWLVGVVQIDHRGFRFGFFVVGFILVATVA
jgi:hypothetical protein